MALPMVSRTGVVNHMDAAGNPSGRHTDVKAEAGIETKRAKFAVDGTKNLGGRGSLLLNFTWSKRRRRERKSTRTISGDVGGILGHERVDLSINLGQFEGA